MWTVIEVRRSAWPNTFHIFWRDHFAIQESHSTDLKSIIRQECCFTGRPTQSLTGLPASEKIRVVSSSAAVFIWGTSLGKKLTRWKREEQDHWLQVLFHLIDWFLCIWVENLFRSLDVKISLVYLEKSLLNRRLNILTFMLGFERDQNHMDSVVMSENAWGPRRQLSSPAEICRSSQSVIEFRCHLRIWRMWFWVELLS